MRLLRALCRMVTAAGVAIVFLVTLSSAARAVPFFGDCKASPDPELPSRTLGNMFPFVPGTGPDRAANSVFEKYGYAGLEFHTYDTGCGPSVLSAPINTALNGIADLMFSTAVFIVAATNQLVRIVFNPTFMQVFDPLVQRATSVLYSNVFLTLGVLVLAVTALSVMWRARGGSVYQSAMTLGWSLVVLVITTALVQWPVVAGHATDRVVTTTIAGINAGFSGGNANVDDQPADEIAASVVDSVLYQQWKRGTFGDPDSAVAKKYADDLFDAQALTWQEDRAYRQDPNGRGQRIIEQKKAQYKAVAASVKKMDPNAYTYLQGERPTARLIAAGSALFATLMITPFMLICCFIVLLSFLIVRLTIMFFPVVAVLALHRKFDGLLKGAAQTAMAAVVNAIVFGAGLAITILFTEIIFAPDNGIPFILEPFLMLVLTIAMFLAFKPHKMTKMMFRHGHEHAFEDSMRRMPDVAHSVGRHAFDVGKKAAAAWAGNAAAAATVTYTTQEREPSPYHKSFGERPEEYSRPHYQPALGPGSGEEPPAQPTDDSGPPPPPPDNGLGSPPAPELGRPEPERDDEGDEVLEGSIIPPGGGPAPEERGPVIMYDSRIGGYNITELSDDDIDDARDARERP